MKKIIIYDFDGTLTPSSIPRYEILEKVGFKEGLFNQEIIKRASELVKNTGIGKVEALYKIYFDIVKKNGFKLTNENFCKGSNNVEYNIGVEDFLDELYENDIKQYILSSGIKVFLDKMNIAHYFEEIYATTFYYDDNNEVSGFKFLMSDKQKVFMIKDILEKNDIDSSNCTNIIYIGDGLTDYDAMEYVTNNGGKAIYLYDDINDMDLIEMKEKEVISFACKADFSKSSELYNYIKSQIN